MIESEARIACHDARKDSPRMGPHAREQARTTPDRGSGSRLDTFLSNLDEITEKVEASVGRRIDFRNLVATLRTKFSDRELDAVIPDPLVCPILAAGAICELAKLTKGSPHDSGEKLAKDSLLSRAYYLPYRPLDAHGFTEVLEGIRKFNSTSGDALKASDYYSIFVTDRGATSINSSCRNIIIALGLNEIFGEFPASEKTPPGELCLCHALYDWETLSRVRLRGSPKPWGEPNTLIRRASIVIVGADCLNEGRAAYTSAIRNFADYGAPQVSGAVCHGWGEGPERCERFPRISTEHFLSPSRSSLVLELLGKLARSNFEAEVQKCVRGATTYLDTAESLRGFPAIEFPLSISRAADLSPVQINELLSLSAKIRSALRLSVTCGAPADAAILPVQRDVAFAISRAQPSSRTITSALQAMMLLGVKNFYGNSDPSSHKGEGAASELAHLRALARGRPIVFLARGPLIDEECKLLQSEDSPIIALSLGGNGHPTQTFSELMALMDQFGVASYSINELAEKTMSSPPSFLYIGPFGNKRCDQELANLIGLHLPHWKQKVLVPRESDLPLDYAAATSGYQIEIRSPEELRDPQVVGKLLRGCTHLYVSNDAATRYDRAPLGIVAPNPSSIAPYFIPYECVENQGITLMHPLPGSDRDDNTGEIDRRLLMPQALEKSWNLIQPVMENKTPVMTAFVALMLRTFDIREGRKAARH